MTSEKKISRRNLIVASVLGGAVAGYAIAVPTLPAIMPSTSEATMKEYTLSYIGDFSGGLIAESNNNKITIEIAVEDYNKYMEATGQKVIFNLETGDSKLTPEGALSAIQTMHQTLGVNAVLVDWSTALAGVKSYSGDNKILVVSGTSTGLGMMIPDNIFRIAAPDKSYGDAIAAAIVEQGIKVHLQVAANDGHMDLVADLINKNLTAKGVTTETMLIPPDIVDYASDVAAAGRKASEMGAHSVGFLTGSNPLRLNFMSHASLDPVLSKLKWWGYDEVTEASLYPPIAPQEIAKFLHSVGHIGVTVPEWKGSKADDLQKKFEARTGKRLESFYLTTYDAAWLTMEAIRQCENDGARMIATFPVIAGRYNGIPGATVLNENGDLLPSNMAYMKVNDSLTGPEAIGIYNAQQQTITWTRTPPSYDSETGTIINP